MIASERRGELHTVARPNYRMQRSARSESSSFPLDAVARAR